MNSAEYDTFAGGCYPNIVIAGEYPEYFHEYKIRMTRDIVNRCGVPADNILDLGSWIGNSIPQGNLETSESRFPELGNNLAIFSRRIRTADPSTDVAFSARVFHHIPMVNMSTERSLRVTRRGGMIAVFEHNPITPLTVRAANSCPSDANSRLMCPSKLLESHRKAGWRSPELRYHVFLPGALSSLRALKPYLTRLVIGAQRSFVAVKQS